MAGWMIAVPIIVVLLVIAAMMGAYYRGRKEGEKWRSSTPDTQENHSLFGNTVPVQETERQLIETMPDALIVADANGAVRYSSPGANTLGIVSNNRLDAHDISDMLLQVVSDGNIREHEVSIENKQQSADRSSGSTAGRGVQAGETLPSNILYLRVRIGRIADGLYAIFLHDMSEQRRFEAMRRDFTTNVAHELKTPSGAITLLSETIADAVDDPDAVRYFSSRIDKEAQRLNELVQRLIDLQRAQNTPALTDVRSWTIQDLVCEAIASVQVQAAAKHITIVLTIAGQRVLIDADGSDNADTAATDSVATDSVASISSTLDSTRGSTVGSTQDSIVGNATGSATGIVAANALTVTVNKESLVTAMKNLIENAIRYSPEHTTVTVSITEHNGTVRIQVVDQGIGIPAESLSRIFERFYRVDPARSRETGGSGLGLAITKHCVQSCGGTISVWSREGEGSTFTVELPSTDSEHIHENTAHSAV